MIQAKNIHKYYGDLQVLKGVDIHIKKGEVVSIVGASGAGKTTLLQILGTLDKPYLKTDFELSINNTSVSSLNDKALAKFRNEHIGFIFQFHQLLPEFTALENVLIPMMIHTATSEQHRDRAKELLATFGLENRMEHYPHQLSGGERQRVALARALMNNPALVLADEPTGNLDRKSGRQLLQAILAFSREHKQTFIIATHDDSIAEQAQRILEIRDGNVSDIKN